MLKRFKYIWVMALLVLPQLAFAASSLTGFLPDFSLFQSSSLVDKSIYWLGDFFGRVGTLLPNGQENHLLGTLFEVFNYGILAIAAMLMVHTVISSVIQTASEGDPMGRENNTTWT